MRPHRLTSLVPAVALAALAACGKSSSSPSSCSPADPNACAGSAVCEPVSGGQPACFAAVVVKGQVTDLATTLAVANARVVVMDANHAPASSVATTDGGGNFTLSVPATRDPSGAPVAATVTLRADAQGYQSFPGGIRTALPIDLSTATLSGGQYVVQGPLTSVKLIKLQSTANLMSISGVVAQPPTRVGVLVVAAPASTPNAGGQSAIAAADGSFTVFNLPGAASPGIAYTVTAYGQGVNYAPGSATLTLGSATPSVNLAVLNTTTATLNGSLIFNSGAQAPTSVALVVESTYNAALDRGESPPGLVAQIPSGSTYTLTGVPDGTYIALAASGIDGDVRDISGTGNTAPVQVAVQAGALVGTLGQFKLVSAVDLSSIDGVTVTNSGAAIQVMSASPAFGWNKTSSYSQAATFRVEVFDAFGTNVWTSSVAGGGGGPFTVAYGGPALVSGMYYQLRIAALSGTGNTLSYTEDQKGVFFK